MTRKGDDEGYALYGRTCSHSDVREWLQVDGQ